jgi:hypothetical protein
MHPKHCKSPLQTHLMHPSQHVSYVSPWVVRVDFYGARQTTGPSPRQRDNESLEQRPIACSSNLPGGGARRGQAMTGQGMNLVQVHVQVSTVMQLGRSQWFWGHQRGGGGGGGGASGPLFIKVPTKQQSSTLLHTADVGGDVQVYAPPTPTQQEPQPRCMWGLNTQRWLPLTSSAQYLNSTGLSLSAATAAVSVGSTSGASYSPRLRHSA